MITSAWPRTSCFQRAGCSRASRRSPAPPAHDRGGGPAPQLLPARGLPPRQPPQPRPELLLQGLLHRLEVLVLVQPLARRRRLEHGAVDDAAHKARPRRQEVALAVAD